MDELHFLTKIFKTGEFSSEELEAIIPAFQPVHFQKNDFLLKEGKVENHYWFVERGLARSFVTNTEGDDITTNFYAAGDIVIEWTSFFLRNATRENIQALTDCSCWQLDYDHFQKLFHEIRRFREQGRTTLVNSYFSLKTHSVSMIADKARDRYMRLVKEKPHIIQNVSLKHIATYLGITDTSLSRIRKEISEDFPFLP